MPKRVFACACNAVKRFCDRRPASVAALGALLGCLCTKYIGFVVFPISALAAALITASGIFRKRKISGLALLLIVFCLFSCLYGEKNKRYDELPIGSYAVTATICEQPLDQSDKHRIVLTLNDVENDSFSLDTKVRLYLYDPDNEYRMGDKLRIDSIKLSVADGVTNPDGFDFNAYLHMRGVDLCGSAQEKNITVIGKERSLKRALLNVRAYLCNKSDEVFGEQSDVIRSMILGDRTILSDETYENFASVGIAHLIAISGLHVSAIALFLEWILKKCKCRRIMRMSAVSAILILYTIMTGSGVSTVRAVIMYVLSSVILLCGYQAELLNILSLTLLIQLGVNPLLIGDNSFLLSYGSVLAIACTGDLIGKSSKETERNPIKKLVRLFIEAGVISVFVEIFTYPLLCRLFYSVPIFSAPVNMLCVPPAMLALYAGIVVLLVGCIWTKAAAVLAVPVKLIWSAIKAVSAWTASLPFSGLNTGSWAILAVCAYGLLAIVCSPYLMRGKTRRMMGITAMLCVILLSVLWPKTPLDHMRVTFLDVGYGDGAVIESEGYFYAVDTGRDNDIVCDYLTSHKATLRGIFVTHPDSDHAGGLPELLRRFPQATVYLPDCWDEMDVSEDIRTLLSKRDTRYLCAGDTLTLSGNVDVSILWPPEGFIPDEDNNGCLVVKMEYVNKSVLFMGDLTDDYDSFIEGDCDILKVAHHGSKYATTEKFLYQTLPEYAVISVSNNSFGHPTDEVLGRLNDIGAYLMRTDTCGAVFADIMKDGTIETSSYLNAER